MTMLMRHSNIVNENSHFQYLHRVGGRSIQLSTRIQPNLLSLVVTPAAKGTQLCLLGQLFCPPTICCQKAILAESTPCIGPRTLL